MDLLITLGLVGVLSALASFLCYYISRALNTNDSHRVDPVPPKDEKQT